MTRISTLHHSAPIKQAAAMQSASSFRLADVMQQLVAKTTASQQQWKHHQKESDKGADYFSTEYQGILVQLKTRAAFGQGEKVTPERVSEWELRFSYPRKKDKVLDGKGLVLPVQNQDESINTHALKHKTGLALIRELIRAVYQYIHQEKTQTAQNNAQAEFSDVLPMIQSLYDDAMDGRVTSCVRHIPASPMNPLAGGATVLEVGDSNNRMEVTSMRSHDSHSVRITLRQGKTVHKLPKQAMDHPVISQCVKKLLDLIQPPATIES